MRLANLKVKVADLDMMKSKERVYTQVVQEIVLENSPKMVTTHSKWIANMTSICVGQCVDM